MVNAIDEVRAEIQRLTELRNTTHRELEEERQKLIQNTPQIQAEIEQLQQQGDGFEKEIRQAKDIAKQLKRDIESWKKSVFNGPALDPDRMKKLEQMQYEVGWRVKKLTANERQIAHLLTEQTKLRHKIETLKYGLQTATDNVSIEADPRLQTILEALGRAQQHMQSIEDSL